MCKVVRVVLVELCFAKMNDSTAILARFVICKLCVLCSSSCALRKVNDSTAILARFMICTDCARCAFRVVLAKNEGQYSDFGKIYDLQS